MRLRTLTRRVSLALAAVALACVAVEARGQAVDVAHRPVNEVRIEGLDQVDERLVRNQIRVEPGDPYDPDAVSRDIQNLTRLGRFFSVRARVDPKPDNTVDLVYVVEEQPLLSDVQVVGNLAFTDQELLEVVMLRSGDPRDPFLIDRGRDEITRMYHDAGYFLADALVDEDTLDETGILIYRVREGPRVRVRQIRFEGNRVFPDGVLRSEIGSETYLPILRAGTLSQEQVDVDVASIREHYRQHGYLDVRVGRRIELSDDQQDAGVTVVIDEGEQYTVSEISVEGNETFSADQLRHAMTLKRGDVFSADRQRTTHEALQDIYGRLGFVDTDVDIARVFDPEEPTVDLRVTVRETERVTVGAVVVRGNELTQDKVIRRELRGLEPGRPYDATGIEESERRLRETGIIDEATITIMGDEEDEVRDALVEVEEAQTGSLSFGAAISSDAGLFGAIDLTQRNFDLLDFPESAGEFFTGRAFRGAGQHFSLSLQPGDRFQRYQVNFREPYLFESGFFLDTSAFFFQRQRESWDERRIGGTIGVGRRIGDVWSARVRSRFEQVRLFDILDRAPQDVFDVAGSSVIDTLGFFVARSTVDSRFFPTEGTRLEAGIERAGLVGDHEFTKLSSEFNAFLTVDEDFFGRKTVLSLRVDSGYILESNQAPLFERFYAGGHRTFRGFDFRGVGPRGIRADTGDVGTEPVGGEFMFLAGLEYNFPIWEEMLRGVVFVDSGTVDRSLSLSKYRVSVGGGVRLSLPFFGQAPFAFDLAYPLVKEPGDDKRIFSFDIALPF